MTVSWSKKKYILIYTLTFILFALGVFFLFLKKSKSMIWNQDGGPQYYPYLIFMGRWLRDAFTRALGGDFTLKMYDFTIGLGSDVGAVIRTHPLEMLSFFVPESAAELLYSFIILLRLYLAGLAFSGCASLYRPLSVHTLTGSMIYVFSGFAVIFCVRHLIYGTAFIMLPLLIAGAEQIIRGRRGWLFSSAVFLGFISNYYFMYQATAACGIFILLRLADRYLREKKPALYETGTDLCPAAYATDPRTAEKAGLVREGKALLRLILFYLLGTAMAMFALAPVVTSLGSSARLSSQSIPENLAFYEGWRHYYRWFLNLIIPVRGQEGGTPLNYAVTAAPAIILMILGSFRQHRVLKGSFIIGTLFIFSPLSAYVLSGFSVVSNRWIFCYSFVIGMAYVVFAEEIMTCRGRKMMAAAGAAGLYFLLAVYDWTVCRSVYLLWAMAALAVCAALIFLCRKIAALRERAGALLLLLTLASCSVNGFLCYSGRFGDMLSQYLDRGQALDMVQNSEFARFGDAASSEKEALGEAAPLWRVDSDLVTSNRENYSLLLGYAPVSMYNSVLSGPLTYFLLETGNCDLAAIHRIQGLDSRTASEALALVRYYVTTADGQAHAPLGFEKNEKLSDANNLVLENTLPLSFGYTYDTVMKGSEFDALAPLEKEQVMLDAAVLADEDAADLLESTQLETAAGPTVRGEEVSLPLPDNGENVRRTDEGYRVLRGGGSISFDFIRRAGCETYVKFEDFWTEKVSNFAAVGTSDMITEFSMRGPDTIYSLNRKDYYIRLGYDAQERPDRLTLYLPERGRYHLGAVRIVHMPADTYAERIGARNEEALQDVRFAVNTVRGTVRSSRECVMAFSVPYSAGWTVRVDGERARALRVNVGWLGTVLTPGEHTVTLSYATPGAVPGRWVSLAAWILFLGLCVPRRRKK